VHGDDLFALWWLVGLRWAGVDFTALEMTVQEQVIVTDRYVRIGLIACRR